jgi:hypothetical protein
MVDAEDIDQKAENRLEPNQPATKADLVWRLALSKICSRTYDSVAFLDLTVPNFLFKCLCESFNISLSILTESTSYSRSHSSILYFRSSWASSTGSWTPRPILTPSRQCRGTQKSLKTQSWQRSAMLAATRTLTSLLCTLITAWICHQGFCH